MTPKGHAIPSKTQLLSYGTPALAGGSFCLCAAGKVEVRDRSYKNLLIFVRLCYTDPIMYA